MKKIISIITLSVMFLFLLPQNFANATGFSYQRGYINTLQGNNSHASTWGDYIVYRDSNYSAKVFYYKISTQEEFLLSDTGTNQKPDIYEDNIVWIQGVNGATNIVMANINNPGNVLTLAEDISNFSPPTIYKNYVSFVITDGLTGECSVYVYDLNLPASETNPKKISVNEGSYAMPKVWENYVVYKREDLDPINLFLYNLDTSQEIPITNHTAGKGVSQYDIKPYNIHNGKIVWADDRQSPGINSGYEVYMYDIATMSETKLTSFPGDSYANNANIYGDKVVYGYLYFDDLSNTQINRMAVIDINSGREYELGDYIYFCSADIYENNIVLAGSILQEYNFEKIILTSFSLPESTPPTFNNIPGETRTVNLSEGELITTNPYIIKTKPTDDSAIEKVEFYVDGVLICTDTEADADGVYSCAWDTSKYHSDIRIVAYDTNGNISDLTRTVNVDPSLYTLPKTGINILNYIFIALLFASLPALVYIRESIK